jgi:L-ribulose-5-phosphate 4-epimerase
MAISGCLRTTTDMEVKNILVENAILKDELISVAKRVYDEGLTSGTGGDISVRIDSSNRFIIKATGYCLGDLNYETLTTLNTDFEILSGNSRPSSEGDIHAALYNLMPEVNAIMHVHAPYVTAWASTGQLVPAITQQSFKTLSNACIVPYFPVGSEELRDTIVNSYKKPDVKVVMMQNHGFFIVGKDLNDLFYRAEMVENTAKIALLCKILGKPVEFNYREVNY